jgi:uncharacterized protein (DUF362 family)
MLQRRTFLAALAGGVLGSGLGAGLPRPGPGGAAGEAALAAGAPGPATVAVVAGAGREQGIRRAVELLGVNAVRGKRVLLKPNFNTADAFPGSTHNDTLEHLVRQLQRMGAGEITVGERSGPPDTAGVLAEKGVPALCERLGVGLLNFEALGPEGWVRVRPAASHWRDGFDVPRALLEADAVVSTCCLKTHAYGGVFTLSLKLAVGLTHKRHMTELHTSFRSMRKMIAEINQAYRPALIVLDATEAFTDGGPSHGTRKRADLIVAGTDRIAVDAVGLAILKDLGANADIMGRPIFAQEQIARAVELGLGVNAPGQIALVSDDEAGRQRAERLRAILAREAV